MTRRIVGKCLLATVAASSLALGACNRKDPQKCQQALDTARSGAKNGQFDAANQWRTYAYKHCDDPSALQKLDQDIIAEKTAREKKKSEKAALDSETLNLMKLFKTFIGDNRQDPGQASTSTQCGTNEDEPDDVWCKGTRWVNRDRHYKFDVRYWKAEPAAAHFRTRAIGDVKCEHFGKAKPVRQWGESTKWWHCTLSDPSVNGLNLLISKTPKETRVEVFSKAYLDRDAKLAERVNP